MNLHIFNDPHGFNLNAVVHRFRDYGVLKNNIFINLNDKTIYKNKIALYLKGTIPRYRQAIRRLPSIETVSFYPFDFIGGHFLKELRRFQPEVKVNWIFWSYEYYHQPSLYPTSLDAFSLAHYNKKKSITGRVSQKIKNALKKILQIPVYNRQLMKQSYPLIQRFYSFLPQDFRNVSAGTSSLKCRYYPISFLSIEEMTKNVLPGNKTAFGEIMIGHAASLTGNHKEVMDRLAELNVSNKIVIPLEYGESEYRHAIKTIAGRLFGNNIQFLEQRLDMTAYHQRLSMVSFAIFNFKFQEGLGNILFLLWAGTKIFLREESSAYLQFKEWGFTIYSVENDLNKASISYPLPDTIADENRRMVEELFSEEKVNIYWHSLYE